MQALVIEDDRATARLVSLLLEEQGFLVHQAHSATEARAAGLADEYDLVVLDLTLPDGGGAAVLRDFRRAGRAVPILVLTGRSGSADVVALLDAGADDYLVKPVENDVFRARVRALLRRGTAVRREVLGAGALVLNVATREALIGGAPLELRAQEYRLLHHLMVNAGAVVTRSELLEKVWDLTFDPGSNVVEVAVARLRRKLDRHGGAPAIVTVRGQGYSLRPPSAPSAPRAETSAPGKTA